MTEISPERSFLRADLRQKRSEFQANQELGLPAPSFQKHFTGNGPIIERTYPDQFRNHCAPVGKVKPAAALVEKDVAS